MSVGRAPGAGEAGRARRSGLETTFHIAEMRGSHGDRAHAPVHREPRRPVPLAAVLGARRRRPRHRPQRPHHQLPPAAPDLRAARRPLLHRERLRGHRRLPRRPAGRRAGRWRRRSRTRSTTSTAASRTSSPPPTRSATRAIRSRSSRSSPSRPPDYVAIANEEIAIRHALGDRRRRPRADRPRLPALAAARAAAAGAAA